MVDLRELIGTAAVKCMALDEWRNLHLDFPDRVSDAVLSALDAAGLVVVPKEPTEEILDAGTRRLWATRRQTNGPITLNVYASREVMDADRVGIREAYAAMLAASYAKKEVE